MRTLIQALKTKELRKKILFVLFIIIVYRIGSFIPTPGVDYNVVNKCMATIGSASQENFIGLVNLFSGGAVHHRVHRGAAAARGHPPLRGPA